MKLETRRETALLERTYPARQGGIPPGEIRGGAYVTRFARSEDELQAVQRLRYEVFNRELGAGLESSHATRLDADVYDRQCHHIVTRLGDDGPLVGTYRVQTASMAVDAAGWYTASEYDLGALPDELLDGAVEAGRACVHREHRTGRVLNHLWRALASYLIHNDKQRLFGCCSITTQDPNVGKAVHDFLRAGSCLRHDVQVRPRAAFRCFDERFQADVNTPVKLPPLFASYLKLGARVISEPALDRQFKTVNFLALLEVEDLDPQARRAFFGR